VGRAKINKGAFAYKIVRTTFFIGGGFILTIECILFLNYVSLFCKSSTFKELTNALTLSVFSSLGTHICTY